MSFRDAFGVNSRGLVFVSATFLLMGCARRPSDERVDVKTSLLPEVAADTKELSSYQPVKPYAAMNNGVLTRTVFQTDGPGGYHVDVQDWQVPPGKQAGGSSLTGGAIIEVRSGAGTLQSGDQKSDLALGAVTSIPQGQAFTISNTGQFPLILRLYVVSAR